MQAPQGSEIRLQIDPGTVIRHRGCNCAGVEEQPRRQEVRVGGQVGGDFLLEDRAGNLVYDAHPDELNA